MKLSKNSIAKIIFIDLRVSYISISEKYFTSGENKLASIEYYEQLEKYFVKKPDAVFVIVKVAMEISRNNFFNK